MAEALKLLDQALELGNTELEHLRSGDVDEAFELSELRDGYTDQAMLCKDSVELSDILDKLEKLKSLQLVITGEAKKLHASLKDEINKTNKNESRLKGYGATLKGSPLVPNMYINKVG